LKDLILVGEMVGLYKDIVAIFNFRTCETKF